MSDETSTRLPSTPFDCETLPVAHTVNVCGLLSQDPRIFVGLTDTRFAAIVVPLWQRLSPDEEEITHEHIPPRITGIQDQLLIG